MFRTISVDGKKIELECNAATGLVYKQVFRRELDKDLGEISAKEMKKVTKALKQVRAEREQLKANTAEGAELAENDAELEQASKLEDHIGKDGVGKLVRLTEALTRLGFIMTVQTKPFKDYWGKVSFEDYVEWRATKDNKELQNSEWIDAVATLWRENNKTTSTEKNQ